MNLKQIREKQFYIDGEPIQNITHHEYMIAIEAIQTATALEVLGEVETIAEKMLPTNENPYLAKYDGDSEESFTKGWNIACNRLHEMLTRKLTALKTQIGGKE